VEQVEREMMKGIQSLLLLLEIIGKSIPQDDAKAIAKSGGHGFNGYSFYVQHTRCFVGVYYSSPNSVQFVAYDVQNDGQDGIGIGRIVSDENRLDWKNELDLTSDELCFFLLPIEQQQNLVERFIHRSIHVVDQLSANETIEPSDAGPLCI
jgi:hypothetical protein